MNTNNPVWEIMTSEVVSVLPNTPAVDIQLLLAKSDFHHIPVVNDDGELLGIISTEDFHRIEKVFANHSLPQLKARQIMTTYPVYLSPDDTIGIAIDLFLKNRFHALPVVENNCLVGIVTTHDIISLTRASNQETEDFIGD